MRSKRRSTGHGRTLWAMADSGPAQLLEWDSAFWGATIGRVVGDELTDERREAVDDWARENSVDCLYFLSRSNDPRTIEVAESAGFRLMDVRVELTQPLELGESIASIRGQRAADLPTLCVIARASHEVTRFFADPHFADEQCRKLYEVWIERSCEGWADAVLVADLDGRPEGYVTCHLGDGSTSSIGLIAVSENLRLRGLGSDLVLGALGWCYEHGATALSVVTQGANVPAQRLFQRCGFRTASVGLWFHKWYRP